MVDFLLLTDDKTIFKYPSNFRVVYTEFNDVRQKFITTLNKKIYLDHPYKFCDYKPLYGYIFSEYISDYKFWGHCDIDMIFGDIDKFLGKISLEDYDRIFPYGHLSIYKNTEKINQAFNFKLGESYPEIFKINFVYNTSFPCNFDEIGVNVIFRKNYKFCEENFCANLNMHYYNYVAGAGTNVNPELLIYDNGKFFIYERTEKDTFVRKEYMYLHMMTVNNLKKIDVKSEKYIICRDGAFDFDEDRIDYYFNEYGLNNDIELQESKTKAVAEKLRQQTKQKILREIRYNKMKAFYTIYKRYKGTKYMINNPLYVY